MIVVLTFAEAVILAFFTSRAAQGGTDHLGTWNLAIVGAWWLVLLGFWAFKRDA